MRGLVFLLGLLFSVLPMLGYLAFDYSIANRAARVMGEEPVSFSTYLGGWVGLAGTLGAGTEPAAALPEGLAAMLPLPPEGWTARPAEKADASLLKGKARSKDARRIAEVLADNRGRGVKTARLAYVPPDGEGLVVVELARYPDAIFTSFAGMGLKMELEMAGLDWADRDFMTVRGLSLSEAVLGPEAAARVFAGDLAGQIHLRAAASRRFSDMDLLALFQTLHVPAMNAAVARPVKGMGQVPVIVVASAMDEAGRALRAAEQKAAAEAARREREEAAAEAEAAKAEAETAAPAPAPEPGAGDGSAAAADPEADPQAQEGPEGGPDDAADEGTGPEDAASIPINRGTGKPRGKEDSLGGECRTENGRKICGVGD